MFYNYIRKYRKDEMIMNEKKYNLFMFVVCNIGMFCYLIALATGRIYIGLCPLFMCFAAGYAIGIIHYFKGFKSASKPVRYRRKKRVKFPENSYYPYIRRSV